MARQTTRPSTAQCTLPMYMGFLIAEPRTVSCTHLAETMMISHDSVNRFLNRELYRPHDLFNESIQGLLLAGGVLSVDDTVIDKPYSHQMAFVSHFWSGKHHRTVKGINLISLHYTDLNGRCVPVNYRLYDKEESKTKNDYFQEMLKEVLAWGLQPAWVTGDTWYSCTQNLKAVKHHGMGLLFGVEKNRTVSAEKGAWVQIQTLTIAPQGLVVWLREYGFVKLFQTHLKDQVRYYIVDLPQTHTNSTQDDPYLDFQYDQFKSLHQAHWRIEEFHRCLKQICNIERFQVRKKRPILNHLFASLCSFVHLQKITLDSLMNSIYQWKRQLYDQVLSSFISRFVSDKAYLMPQLKSAVNA